MLNVVLASEEDAKAVRETLLKLLANYEVVTQGDLWNLVGRDTTYSDEKVGWTELKDLQIKPVEEGFALELPDPQLVR